MPVYEYFCKVCDNVWEREEKITAEPNLECPQCRCWSGTRQITSTSFLLKGEGWAADNYSKKK